MCLIILLTEQENLELPLIPPSALYGLPLWHSGKEQGKEQSIPGLGRPPGEGNGNPFQYSCLEKSHEQGSLVATVNGGCKELDTQYFKGTSI